MAPDPRLTYVVPSMDKGVGGRRGFQIPRRTLSAHPGAPRRGPGQPREHGQPPLGARPETISSPRAPSPIPGRPRQDEDPADALVRGAFGAPRPGGRHQRYSGLIRGSDSGGLPETLADCGTVLPIDAEYGVKNHRMPPPAARRRGPPRHTLETLWTMGRNTPRSGSAARARGSRGSPSDWLQPTWMSSARCVGAGLGPRRCL